MLKNKAVIFGLEGKTINQQERSFFTEHNPLGYILFARNIETPEQVRALVSDIKDMAGWNCPILIDQEGGRVARLRPPHWRKSPPMGDFACMALENLDEAEKATYENACQMALELVDIGVNVDCAPVCDLLFEGAHDIVGDRSFGSDVTIASKLARKTAQGLMDNGVLPIIKHIPGHGRAKADSHKELPVVKASLAELEATDFAIFKNLADMPWAMTAHILYTAIDEKQPATLSSKVIDIIRNNIGFDGVLLTDDLSMEALQGSFADRTINSLKAGCDVVLHCNGKMEEMTPIAENTPQLSAESSRRVEKSLEVFFSKESESVRV